MQIGHAFTTPFGRRQVSFGQLAAQVAARNVAEEASVDKWKLFRDLCAARGRLGLSDRALLVLNALLSFYPKPELSEENGLIVFPSNAQLSLRAHGMAPATLRRHLSALVEAGLIIRKDSANGKRFARKSRSGEAEEGRGEAFGFNIAPLIARQEEIAALADEVRAEQLRIKALREQLTLVRRDLVKLIEYGIDVAPDADWPAFQTRFRDTIGALPRQPAEEDMQLVLDGLDCLHLEISKFLENFMNSQKTSATESHFERHKQNSNTHHNSELEPRKESDGADGQAGTGQGKADAGNRLEMVQVSRRESAKHGAGKGLPDEKPVPLGLVLKACPDIVDYARGGVASWRDLMAAAVIVRSMLGVSPSAYEDACMVLGQERAAIVVACILQRAEHIKSAGGYLRNLTEKARNEAFSVWPMLLAQLRANGGHLAVVPDRT